MVKNFKRKILIIIFLSIKILLYSESLEVKVKEWSIKNNTLSYAIELRNCLNEEIILPNTELQLYTIKDGVINLAFYFPLYYFGAMNLEELHSDAKQNFLRLKDQERFEITGKVELYRDSFTFYDFDKVTSETTFSIQKSIFNTNIHNIKAIFSYIPAFQFDQLSFNNLDEIFFLQIFPDVISFHNFEQLALCDKFKYINEYLKDFSWEHTAPFYCDLLISSIYEEKYTFGLKYPFEKKTSSKYEIHQFYKELMKAIKELDIDELKSKKDFSMENLVYLVYSINKIKDNFFRTDKICKLMCKKILEAYDKTIYNAHQTDILIQMIYENRYLNYDWIKIAKIRDNYESYHIASIAYWKKQVRY